MEKSLLDTDILSEVLKARNARVLATEEQYLSEHQRFAFSEITVYEIVRGMRFKGATQQLAAFLNTVSTSEVCPINRSVLMRATELWVDARSGGHPKNDADLIIAATALEAGLVLMTGNISHFNWIDGLQVADWRTQ